MIKYEENISFLEAKKIVNLYMMENRYATVVWRENPVGINKEPDRLKTTTSGTKQLALVPRRTMHLGGNKKRESCNKYSCHSPKNIHRETQYSNQNEYSKRNLINLNFFKLLGEKHAKL